MEYDDNGHRIIDNENPVIYDIVGSVQDTEQVVQWVEEGTTLNETRALFLPFPYKHVDGSELNFQIRTRQNKEEDVPVDVIEHDNEEYDLVEKIADYPQYGYEQYVIQRVN